MPIYEVKNKEGKIIGYRVQVNYTDSFGKKQVVVRQNENTRKKQDAKKLEAKILSEVAFSSNSNKNITLDQLYDYYCDTHRSEIKLSTLEKIQRTYLNHIKEYFGSKRVVNISLIDFQNWKNEINKINVKISTKQNIYKVFNQIMNFAVKYDFVQTNYLNKLGNFKTTVLIPRKMEVWTKEEFDKFISAVRQNCEYLEKNGDKDHRIQWAYYVMFNIMFYCGCRKSEVYPLLWADIDFDNRILHINKGLVYKIKGAKEGYIISTPKTKNSIRDIKMPNQLITILKEHKKRYENVYMFDDNFFVCGGIDPLKDTTLDSKKEKFCNISGVKEITIHEFRHSHATMLINKGVNMFVVKERMGHSSIQETIDTYSQLYPKTEDEAVELINSLG